MRKVLALLAVLLLGAGVAAAGGYSWYGRAVAAKGPAGENVIVEVPRGASASKVGQLLLERGLVVADPLAVKLWLRLNPPAAPKAGRHQLRPDMSLPELFAAVAENPIPDDVPVTMVEGWRLRDADAELAKAGRIEAGAYVAAAASKAGFSVDFPVEGDSLAGYLLPETYLVPPGPIDCRALVQRQLEAFHKRFYAPHKAEIEKSGRTLRELVILASLLEREEPKPEVRPKVAGVLYNRLDAKTPLGVDATSRYTLDDWSDRRAFLTKLRDKDDPWNTRLKAGLPPGPIGAPSLASLLAALRPEASDNWYYLHDKDQNIHFSADAAGHEAKRRKYNVW